MLFLKGIIIGIGKIIPGVSGSMLAISMGIYQRMIDSINNFFKDIKKNSMFLLKIGIGVLISIVFFSNIILKCLNNYYIITIFFFIGLIIGSFEDINNEMLEEEKLINEIKELLSDNKNYIKITDMVNNQLKIYVSKSSLYKENYDVSDDEKFVKTVELYKKDVDLLLKIVILLTYYGGELYSNLILKIISRIMPKENSMYLLYYPLYLVYYVAIVSAIESKNYKVLEDILQLEKYKTISSGSYYDENNLLTNTCDNMENLMKDYKVFFPENNYKYPLSEYLYKELQPLIDDFLYFVLNI